jgi:hypothetical protein
VTGCNPVAKNALPLKAAGLSKTPIPRDPTLSVTDKVPKMVNVETGDLSKHTRSPESLKRREQRMSAKQFMWENSFQDPILAETVNLVNSKEILGFLGDKYGEADPNLVHEAAFSGCVLSDSRGNGAFQMMKCPHSESIFDCVHFPYCDHCSVFLEKGKLR